MTPWQGNYQFFTAKEMQCKDNCGGLPPHDFMLKLETIRQEAGFSFIVSSGFRCPIYNTVVSESGMGGPHTKGAVDIKVYGPRALRVVELAIKHGALGIGISQKGNVNNRFIHIDWADIPERGGNRAIWSY